MGDSEPTKQEIADDENCLAQKAGKGKSPRNLQVRNPLLKESMGTQGERERMRHHSEVSQAVANDVDEAEQEKRAKIRQVDEEDHKDSEEG